MRYYLLDNRILYQTKDDDGKVIGFGVKQPIFMKQYPYYKLSFSPDGSQCIVQTESEVMEKEAKELTLEDAQKQTDKWIEGYEPATKSVEIVDETTGKTMLVDQFTDWKMDIKSYNADTIKDTMQKMHKAVSING